jgi:ribosomal protein S18 acetylase RimI-like enzyme
MDVIVALEQCAYTAWPAEELEELDGWRLRAMRGVTRRANSAWTATTGTRLSLQARIEAVEAFYAARAQPSVIQLSQATALPGLDARLDDRGYQLEAAVSVQIADAVQVAGNAPDQAAHQQARASGVGVTARMRVRVQVQVEARPFDAWCDISCRRGRFAGVEDVYRGLLDRLADHVADRKLAAVLFAIAEVDGQPAAAGMAIVDGPWGGIFSMLTLAVHRRHGAASAVLRALAQRSVACGARGLYLQVERENRPATALYARFGFSECYGYHYRVRPIAAPSPRAGNQ